MTCFTPLVATQPPHLKLENKFLFQPCQGRFISHGDMQIWSPDTPAHIRDQAAQLSLNSQHVTEDSIGRRTYTPAKLFYFPCGKCLGCRADRARDWSNRVVHELRFSPASCFLTLTYNEASLPQDRSLYHRDVQLFLKRLRRKLGSTAKIRYFGCGEYGSKRGRPHYHIIIFGHDCNFGDLFVTSKLGAINTTYRSPTLEGLWGDKGMICIGSATADSANYTARYILKKQAKAWYNLARRKPEYTMCSTRPGIGANYFHRFYKTIFPRDFLITPKLLKNPVPRFYYKLLERFHPVLFEQVKQKRQLYAAEQQFDPDFFRKRYNKLLHMLQLFKVALPRTLDATLT